MTPNQQTATRQTLLLLIASVVAMRFYLNIHSEIAWFEFASLSRSYQFFTGISYVDTVNTAYEAFFLLLFFHLAETPGTEIANIIFMRQCLLALATFSAWLFYRLCKRFAHRNLALLATLCLLSFPPGGELVNQLNPGTMAFALGLVASCLFLLSTRPVIVFIIVPLVMGSAMLLHLAALLYIPVFMTPLLLGQSRHYLPGKTTSTITTFILATLLCYTLALYFLDNYLLATDPLQIARNRITHCNDALSLLTCNNFLKDHLNLTYQNWEITLLPWTLFFISPFAAIVALSTREAPSTVLKALLLIYLLTVVSLLLPPFAQHFPTFLFAPLLPGAILLSAIKLDPHFQSSSIAQQRQWLTGITSLIWLTTCLFWAKDLTTDNHTQRQTLQIVHKLFDTPVNYIDCCATIASFHKKGPIFPVSTQNRHGGAPPNSLKTAMRKYQPMFIIANTPWLEQVFRKPFDSEFSKDEFNLRHNYLHHAGQIYTVGKNYELEDFRPVHTRFMIAGTYQLHSDKPALINNQEFAPGEIIYFKSRSYRLQGTTPEQHITLRHILMSKTNGHRQITSGLLAM